MQATGSAFDLILGLSTMLLGVIQLIVPHAAIRLRNRFGNAKYLDGAHWIFSSKHAPLLVRLLG